jgi:hypothetical protein
VPSYERSVFLNCPFDDLFAPLFHAAVLTIAALGFTPRCARETEGESDQRIDRIARGLRESKYSIHDLSRFQGEGPDNLSRFNMPLELGMALSIRYQGKTSGTPHNWVALVPSGFVHQKFISDLAGFDPPVHEQTPISVIRAIWGWLTIQPDYSPPAPSPSHHSGGLPEIGRIVGRGQDRGARPSDVAGDRQECGACDYGDERAPDLARRGHRN